MRRRLARLALLALLAGCGPSAPETTNPALTDPKRFLDLNKLMKNDINPSFSRLVFFTFHGEEEEPAVVKAELERAAASLIAAFGRLRQWKDPPTQTPQAREVFYTYAGAVDRLTMKLADAIGRDDLDATAKQLEHIANTCNSCHHFFRLRIADSVVPKR